jgi:hypothetical protein
MPFANREVSQNNANLIDDIDISDVVQQNVREIPAPQTNGFNAVNNSFAYRLDFISYLYQNGMNYGAKEVIYGTGAAPTTDTTIGGTNVAVKNLPDPAGGTAPSVHLIYSPDGTMPEKPFSATPNTVGNDDVDGLLTAAQRYVFQPGVNYTALSTNVAKQAQLFVVPTTKNEDPAQEISTFASEIENKINSLLQGFNASIADFLAESGDGISFDTQRSQGFGDLYTQLYLNMALCSCFWLEPRLGVVFKTGEKNTHPGKLFALPIGNGGHNEINLGLAGGISQFAWMKFYGDVSYNWVLASTEKVAGSFKGATVKNIGPTVDARVKWNYFLAHADVTFVPTCCKWVGVDLGWEFGLKQHDKICFDQATAVDFANQLKALDPAILQSGTRQVWNKLSVELFSNHECVDVFGGFAYVVSGKNAPREALWHLGFAVKF